MSKPAIPARLLKTPYIVVLLVAVLVVPVSASGFVWARKGVTVVVDGSTAYYRTQADTVASVLKEASVAVEAKDVVSPALDTVVADGTTIVVRHATTVQIDCNGDLLEVDVVGSTVADALVAAGLDPSLGLQVTPSVEAPLRGGMTIVAKDVFLRISQQDVELPFDTIEQSDPNLASGKRRIVSEGKVGRGIRVYEIVVTGGIEGMRYVKAEQIRTQPIAQVVAIGAKRAPRRLTFASNKSGNHVAPRVGTAPAEGKRIAMTATAYTPWDPGCGGISVIERKLKAYDVPSGWGIIAVDPAVIPLGSRVYVSGYGNAIAADTGGAIKGQRIDVCFWAGGESASRSAAINWGRRSVTVIILK